MPNQNEQDLQINAAKPVQKSEEDRNIMKNLLKSIELFQHLSEDMLNKLSEVSIMNYFPEKYVIFQEGDSGDCMYVIKSGIVRIFHPGETASFDKEVAMHGDNNFFGEMALLEEKPRNASAQTTEPTIVFIIKKADFLELISSDPEIAAKVSKDFLDRVKENSRESSSN